jgi:hypothetical protein
MKNTIHTKNNVIQNNHRTAFNIANAILALLVISFLGISFTAHAQDVVKIPKSEVSTTGKHYKYTYKISPSQHKVIEYILVLASNGDVKSCFNACDVCYPSHKGYSQPQNGPKLRCNNCGNQFVINDLGSQGSGGCWPGHLPNTIEGDNVVITAADLAKGEYFFVSQTTGVQEYLQNAFSIENLDNSELRVKLNIPHKNNFNIIALDGKLCKQITHDSDEFEINISDLISGVYFITAEFDGKPVSKSFNITR